LNRFLPAGWRDAALVFYGGIVLNAAGRLTAVTPVMNYTDFYEAWGDPSTELVRFDSTDGGRTFTSRLLDAPDPKNPRWMPSLERPTGFNEVSGSPGLIYTEGAAGGGLSDMLTNKVWWRMLD
jgi:hypothetical protein